VYSDFYEIPLPALRFEKVEETNTKVKNDTIEKRRLQKKFDHDKKPKENDAQRKADLLARKQHAKKTQKRFQNQSI